ncbi:unnamed protein product [Darwinula stevensoni]|uniref:Kringle domain-containing protein n=1 Tax=Darwinula stevensoni TaxID=69355 RepID=A0A7R8X9M9_9CRUS|nr:unnamed protein product [Darwinula stevensoni]CAG0891254.1 unnamed protein product [Darwinula stevensoni]
MCRSICGLIDELVYPECRLTEMGKEYIGTVNVTKNGKPCLRWDSPDVKSSYKTVGKGFYEGMFFEEHFLNQDPSSHENFCRNPSRNDMPWCFVNDGGFTWEYCWIPFCDDLKAPECKKTQKGAEYMGTQNKAIHGSPCLAWLGEQGLSPELRFAMKGQAFPDSITDEHNYCRNPTGRPGGPWCKVPGSEENWEYCDVRFCAMEDAERTCETEDRCSSSESQVTGIYPECRMTSMGKEYRGTHSQTESGKTCKKWYSISLIIHTQDLLNPLFPYRPYHERHLASLDFENHAFEIIMKQDENYCRNPVRAERPWCIVSLEPFGWEYCDIPFCLRPKEPLECQLTTMGLEYAGFKNTDADGRKCQPWLGRANDKRFSVMNIMTISDEGIDSSHNYCRNPDANGYGLWCFTEEGTGERWGHCMVPFCYQLYERIAVEGKIMTGKPAEGYPECLQTAMGKGYVGTTRKTKTGKPCLRWDSQPYGKPEDFDSNATYEVHFRFGNSTLHQDFCRNPTLRHQPWCFVQEPHIEWEFCQIPFCPNYPNKTECRWTKEGEEYAGTRNKSSSGLPCKRWDEFESQIAFWPRFPEDVKSEKHNFCRNPSMEEEGPYCYISSADKEFCDIPFCPFQYLY